MSRRISQLPTYTDTITGSEEVAIEINGFNYKLPLSSVLSYINSNLVTSTSTMQKLIKTAALINIPASTATFVPLFRYTGKIKIQEITLYNNTISSAANGSFQATGMAVNDSLTSTTNLVLLSSSTVNMNSSVIGHILRHTGASSVVYNPITSNNIVGSSGATNVNYIQAASTGNSYMGFNVATNNSSATYTASYDIVVYWEPITTGATLIAL